MGLHTTVSPTRRSHLATIVLLSCLTFAYGFVSAFPSPKTEQSQSGPHTDEIAVAVAPLGDMAAAPSTAAMGRCAVFTCVLPFPFESVLAKWENGPPDPNFIKEDVVVETSGSEQHNTKTIYVKNPLPFIIRKTVSTTQFIFCVYRFDGCNAPVDFDSFTCTHFWKPLRENCACSSSCEKGACVLKAGGRSMRSCC